MKPEMISSWLKCKFLKNDGTNIEQESQKVNIYEAYLKSETESHSSSCLCVQISTLNCRIYVCRVLDIRFNGSRSWRVMQDPGSLVAV